MLDPMPFGDRVRRAAKLGFALSAAAALWLPSLQFVFAPSEQALFGTPTSVAPMAQQLSVRVLAPWWDARGTERSQLRQTNPEWDLMHRTFLVLSMANLALRDPSQSAHYLAAMDRAIDDTLERERQHGQQHFLLGYGSSERWNGRPVRSVFVDGEVALMLGARRMLREEPRYREEFRARLERFVPVMERSPLRSAESYPNENWVFCNAVALAATRFADVLDHTDHEALRAAWVRTARERLVEPRSGLLVSSYENDGRWRDGPEGSSLFMAAHALRLVDDAFARDQWQRARAQLGRTWLGVGFAREWPEGLENPADVDSGPTVPFVGANAGASGLALLGAAAFGDRAWLRALATSLEFAAFPDRSHGTLRYRASNGVGDAVLLYALVEGPLWERVRTAGGAR